MSQTDENKSYTTKFTSLTKEAIAEMESLSIPITINGMTEKEFLKAHGFDDKTSLVPVVSDPKVKVIWKEIKE